MQQNAGSATAAGSGPAAPPRRAVGDARLACPWDASRSINVGNVVQTIVKSYQVASDVAVPRARLDPFVERLAHAANECVAAFPGIDAMLMKAQRHADDPSAVLDEMDDDVRLVRAAFARFGWDGPYWAQSERVLVPVDAIDATADAKDAQARAAELMLTAWADYAHRWRAGHVTDELAA